MATGRPRRFDGEPGGAAGKAADIVGAFEAMPAIVWAFSGPDHVIVAANRAARASIGDRPDIIGRPVRAVVPEAAGQNVYELLDEVYRTGQPRTNQARRMLFDSDNDGEPEEGFFDFTALPVCDAEGRVSGVLAHVSDVTATIRARRAAQPRKPASHDLAHTLQHSLLPTELPVAPGVRVAAQYVAAGTDQEVGGDWFDAVLLEDGTVAAAVGDVASRGVSAATAMGQLRSALIAYALAGSNEVDLLDRLDGFARHVPAAIGATVCVTLFDPSTGELRYASAGHPPPLVVRADGTAQYLAPADGRPLGLTDEPRTGCTERLGADEVLVLYSDGAITRPGLSIEQGRSRLAAAARSAASGPGAGGGAEAVCARLVAELTGNRAPHDDIALLVLHRLGEPVPPLRISAPARPGQLAMLRQRLHEWMFASGIGENDAVSVQIAVGEAASNVVEHAYPADQPGEVWLAAAVSPSGELHVEVADQGRWRDPRRDNDDARRGRGLPLMRACMDSLELVRSNGGNGRDGGNGGVGGAGGVGGVGGTVVRMRRRLRRPIAATTDAVTPEPSRSSTAHADLDVVAGPDRVLVRLRGDLDLPAVEQISGRVRAATRGGTVAATVDLTGVSHLASAAVRLLFELAADGERHRQPMIVWAAAGSAAEQVIRLTGLDQVVEVYRRPARR